MNLRSRRTWLWLIGIFGALGFLNFGHFYLDDLARQHYGTAAPRFIEELTAAYSALVSVPIVVWIAQRFRWSARTWPAAALANLGGFVLYSLLHTTLMATSRAAIFPLLGMGRYDYGVMYLRYPMEAASDSLLYALMTSAVYVLSRIRAARADQLAAAQLRTQLAEAQLENLRLQLHPHFLFNTLNAISAVMYEDVRKADKMLTKLSDFLREVLASSNVQCVSIEEELDLERQYVDIMTTRLERALAFNIDVAADALEAQVPFMLLQPLLENSIRHGLSGSRAALDIDVRVRRDGDSTVVEVLDDGAGLANGAALHGHGLTNVESRLAHMYGSAAGFTIASQDKGGTRVTLRFPYRHAEISRP